MIKSTVALLYDARNGQKSAVIEMEVSSWEVSSNGVRYNVNDYAVIGNVKELISTKTVLYSWDQINSLNDYLESQNTYKGLNKRDLEFLKVKQALLLETKTNPVYLSTPNQWIYTE